VATVRGGRRRAGRRNRPGGRTPTALLPARSRPSSAGRTRCGPATAARARPSAVSSRSADASLGFGAWSGMRFGAPDPSFRRRGKTEGARSSMPKDGAARSTPRVLSAAGRTSVTARPGRRASRSRRWIVSSGSSRPSPGRFARTRTGRGRSPTGWSNRGEPRRHAAAPRAGGLWQQQQGHRCGGPRGLGHGRLGGQSLAGGCYAVCDARQVCNPESGLCENNPCGLGCGPARRCDLHGPVPRCVDDSVPTDLVRGPPPAPDLPVAPPP
jgi:hypothetical protein